MPGTGRLRFIEVKGRITGAETVTVTKNEILAGLNKPEDYWLAVVEVSFADGQARAGLTSAAVEHLIARHLRSGGGLGGRHLRHGLAELLQQ